MPDLKYRYLAEDVPTGLCFAKGLADLLSIPTPTIDKVLSWAQGCIGLELMVDGKWIGKDLSKTRAPQGVGITTLEQFIEMAKVEPTLSPEEDKSKSMICDKLGLKVQFSMVKLLFEKISARSSRSMSDKDIANLMTLAEVDSAGNVNLRKFLNDVMVKGKA